MFLDSRCSFSSTAIARIPIQQPTFGLHSLDQSHVPLAYPLTTALLRVSPREATRMRIPAIMRLFPVTSITSWPGTLLSLDVALAGFDREKMSSPDKSWSG